MKRTLRKTYTQKNIHSEKCTSRKTHTHKNVFSEKRTLRKTYTQKKHTLRKMYTKKNVHPKKWKIQNYFFSKFKEKLKNLTFGKKALLKGSSKVNRFASQLKKTRI